MDYQGSVSRRIKSALDGVAGSRALLGCQGRVEVVVVKSKTQSLQTGRPDKVQG